MIHIYDFAKQEPRSEDAELIVEGCDCPLHIARVSAVPINRRWPGYQRSLDQTELASFGMFATDGPAQVVVRPHRSWSNAVVRPLASKCEITETDGEIRFTIPGPGYYSVELDGSHNALLLFADSMECAKVSVSDSNVRYFGPGYHEAGLIELHENETLFFDEGAVVFGYIKAIDANNIRIVGHGILDGSHNVEQPLPNVNPQLLEEQRRKGFEITNVTRDNTIQLEYCDDVIIDGITIRDSLVYSVRPICCRRLKIENLKVIGNWRYNSDGINSHNSEDVVIRQCFLRTYDDTICVKGFDYEQNEADMVHNGITYDVARNILVEKCVLWNDWGHTLEIGAETRAREICAVTFRNCDIIHHSEVACDVLNVDYAVVHDITYEDIRVEYQDVCQRQRLQMSDDDVFQENPESTYLPSLISVNIFLVPEYAKDGIKRGINHSIHFKNISVIAPRMPESFIGGYDEQHQSHDIFIENLSLNGKLVNTLKDANVTQGPFSSNIYIR